MISLSQGIRNTVNEYLLSFGGYDWLWKDDKDEAYDDFMSKNPSLDDYEAKLKTFSATEDEIGEEISLKNCWGGCYSLFFFRWSRPLTLFLQVYRTCMTDNERAIKAPPNRPRRWKNRRNNLIKQDCNKQVIFS